jgi:GNAT superfamily N-acetyltransferase
MSMTAELDVHEASPDELVAAHRNVHDIWNKGLSLDEHVRYRLESPSHRRATWYVGVHEGRVVTSLGCYPIHFRISGRRVSGIAIGSVYTLSEFRGRGCAPRLIDWVEQHERDRRAALSVLYSDIEPQYYARRGYTICPAWEGWTHPNEIAELAGGPRLKPISAEEHLEKLARLYADYHGAAALSVDRDEEYWRAMLKKSPTDTFHALVDDRGAWQGYVRLVAKSGAWRITDYALADQSEASCEALYRALAVGARAEGVSKLGGWVPDSPAARKFFKLSPRPREITMIKSLADQIVLDPPLVASTHRFCEIDHV